MQKWFAILLLSILVMVQACSKQSAKGTDSQESVPAGSSKSPNTSSNPSAETPDQAPAPAATEGSAPAAASHPAANPAREAQSAPTQPAPPKPLVVPAGTTLTVRLGQTLGSKSSQTGESFTATVIQPVNVNSKVAIPAASAVKGSVVNAQAKGKVKGEAVLQLALKEITVKGHAYPIETSMASTTSKGKGKRNAVTTGGGALIGGIAGGGKGAAIGAAAGFAGGALTGNKQIEIPAESVLSFQLKKPLTLK